MQDCAKTKGTWAIEFAKRGWPVLPLHYPLAEGQCSCRKPGCSSAAKHPMTKNGLKNASAGPATVMSWWKETPRANVGILTGAESGLVVLDIDPRHGGEQSLAELENQFGELPATLKVRTGGDGWHFYFAHPGGQIRNKTNIRPGIDLRGDGGYIVAPPSVHASMGNYAWDGSADQLANLPRWLLELIQSKPIADQSENQVAANLLEGGRNSSLMSIGGFLKTKGFDQNSIQATLNAINGSVCNPPLPDSEVSRITSSVGRYQEQNWSKPGELPSEVKAPAMGEHMLPEALRAWCCDISERMQVPLEFVAGPAIVAISSVIGRKMALYPKTKDDWKAIPNLWGVLIAPPGSMKSPAMSAVLKPLQNLAVKAREDYLQEIKQIETEKTVAKAEIDALKDALKSAVKIGSQDKVGEKKEALEQALRKFEDSYEVNEKRYMMNDPTIEKMLTILQENPQGLLLYRDELSGWMETMYKSGREGDREFFLESWNGDTPYSMDRIGRGTVFVDGLCLSVLGGLQPTKFESYVAALAKGGKSDDGLLQRFQILLSPEKRKHWKRIDRQPDHQAARLVEDIFGKIADIPNPERVDGETKRIEVRFTTDAQEAFDDWHEGLELRLLAATGSHIMENHLSKYRSLMPSLALIFEVVSQISKGSADISEVSIDSVNLAAEWCKFLELHARKAYGEYLEPDLVSARRLLAKAKSGAVKDFDKLRDIYRHGWKNLTTPKDLEDGLKVLESYGWARIEVMSPPAGRRFEVIRLHPSLRAV